MKLPWICVSLLLHFNAACQPDSVSLENELFQKQSPELLQFYQACNNRLVWFGDGGEGGRKKLCSYLDSIGFKGLEKNTYAYAFVTASVKADKKPVSKKDSLTAELLMTEAAISYVKSLVYGNNKPEFMYEDFVCKPVENFAGITGEYCGRNQFSLLVDSLTPRLPEIRMLEEKLTGIRQRVTATAYQEERVISVAATRTNLPLVRKLFALGAIDSLQPLSDNTVKNGVKEAQQQFTLLNDGVLRSTAIEQLNVSVSERIRQLEMALDYYRWLHAACISEPVIVVNIPGAYLKVYYKDSILLGMRMIVGKPATPTPTLTSRVDEIVFYPYWNVPRNIAVGELLPSIKQNIGYIEAGNYQILDNSGNILDPEKINWSRMTASNFPYRIRQSTGCDNALGIVKVNFYNPFTVYLHDTHGRELFMLNRRFFSHGCMRMEKPMEIVRLLLDDQPIPSSIDTSVCKTDQSPVAVKTDTHTPVVVWYNPVGIDDTGRLVFFEDVYRRLSEGKGKSRGSK